MPTCTRTVRARRNRRAPKWAAALAVVFGFGGGEAAAQLTADDTFHGNGLKVDVAERVTEGANATITVTLKASVAANTPSTTVTVSVEVERHGVGEATSEPADVSLNPGAVTLTFPANTTGSAVTREVSGTILLQTNHDPDAEDETVVLARCAGVRVPTAASGPRCNRLSRQLLGDPGGHPRRCCLPVHRRVGYC